MPKKETTPPDKQALRKRIEAKLLSRGITDPIRATDEQLYIAVASTLRDMLTERREAFMRRRRAKEVKEVYYLCMEFLVGRSLFTVASRMKLAEELSDLLPAWGRSLEALCAVEVDPGLGNGGLGRLAACFMEALTAKDYAAVGYSLLYEHGFFRQRLVDGEQVELPETWLQDGGPFLCPHPEMSVTVRFGGVVEEVWEENELRILHTEYDEVRAIPYDLLIVGTETDAVNPLRLWRARGLSGDEVERQLSQGTYVRALERRDTAARITDQLYPPDHMDEGKLLRLSQQYFLVSASLQNIISEYFARYGTLDGFEDRVAIHLNDTHPTLCIPELMRILMDVYSYSWEDAWHTVTRTVSYTNHTVMPEALECWRTDLFRLKLPRILSIINEINRRFCADLWQLYPGDWDRISRMAIIAYGQVRMANLSVVASHTVNGVSKLHSDILKRTVFRDFYQMTPWKFTSVTNGIAHRRWLCDANPALCGLLDECIGEGYRRDAALLSSLTDHADDAAVLARLGAIKRENKARFAAFVKERYGRTVDAASVYDVQIKRMHEYKRQLLNVLKIISLAESLRADPQMDVIPQTFFFGAKAAPGYVMAKELIRLTYFLGKELESDQRLRDKLRVVFLEDYNVSLAERLIPAAELSEQISLAGKEASGTGNMKLMMNGAITLGTMDGANVEIFDAVGEMGAYIFGLTTAEVDEIWHRGYRAKEIYHNSERLRAVIDRLYGRIGGEDFSHIAEYLIGGGQAVADPYMCLADFDSYCATHKRALADYRNAEEWCKKSLYNIAASGRFSADRAIRTYADEIWHVSPVGR